MFRPGAPFPATIENVHVEQTVSFLGPDTDSPHVLAEFFKTMNALWTGASQWAPYITYPPEPDKLWKAFYTEMCKKRPIEQDRENRGLILGNENTNKFEIRFTKETNLPY